jgi:hypothetical protein
VVLEARGRRPGVDRADLARRQRVAVVVEDLELVPGERLADAPGMLEPLLRADHGAAALGRAEVLPDLLGADEVHERPLERHWARGGGVHDDFERRQVVSAADVLG